MKINALYLVFDNGKFLMNRYFPLAKNLTILNHVMLRF